MKNSIMLLILSCGCLPALYAADMPVTASDSDEKVVKENVFEDRLVGDNTIERVDLATEKVVETRTIPEKPAPVSEAVQKDSEEAVQEFVVKPAKEVEVVTEEVKEEEPKPLTQEEQEQFLKDLGLDDDEGGPATSEE